MAGQPLRSASSVAARRSEYALYGRSIRSPPGTYVRASSPTLATWRAEQMMVVQRPSSWLPSIAPTRKAAAVDRSSAPEHRPNLAAQRRRSHPLRPLAPAGHPPHDLEHPPGTENEL